MKYVYPYLLRSIRGVSSGASRLLHTTRVQANDDSASATGGAGEKTINQVTLLGRIGSGPQQRGSEENPVAIFSLATHSNFSGEMGQRTEWHRVCVFKPALRDSVLKFANKGQRVLVQGRIIYGEIKDAEGQTRNTCTIAADDVIYFRNN
nr:EOG090X0O5J [Leptodora kindtii]